MSRFLSTMSSETVTSFTHSPDESTAVLSSGLSDSGPYVIHGVAIGSGDVTYGQSRIKKKWPGEELRKAAGTLADKPLVKDHVNTVDGVIGRVTEAKYKEDVGVIYEAEVSEQYRNIAQKIADGLLEVSPRLGHAHVDSLQKDEESGALITKNVFFDNLSVVTRGASPSNTAEQGEHAELSVAELQAAFDYDAESQDSREELDLSNVAVRGIENTASEDELAAIEHLSVYRSDTDTDSSRE